MTQSFSDQIAIATTYLENLGWKIITFSDKLPEGVYGRIYYVNKEIHLSDRIPSAEQALFTLLHEGGHALSYIKYYEVLGEKQPITEKRELYAYLYGWVLIKKLKIEISKEIWRKKNK
jgi:hypothetical protein